jgi:hypothetical protein
MKKNTSSVLLLILEDSWLKKVLFKVEKMVNLINMIIFVGRLV